MPAWVPLDESIVPEQVNHIDDHEQAHNWANAFHTRLVATSATLSDSDGLVIVSSTGAARTITLPSAATNGEGGFVILRKGQNTVKINRTGSDKFNDGSTAKTLASNGAAISVMALNGGSTWFIAGERGTVL